MKTTMLKMTAMTTMLAVTMTAGVAAAQRPAPQPAGGSINGGPFVPLKPHVVQPAGGSIDGGPFVPVRRVPPPPPVPPPGPARYDFYQCGRNVVAVVKGGPAPRGCRHVGDGIIDSRRVDPRTGLVLSALQGAR